MSSFIELLGFFENTEKKLIIPVAIECLENYEDCIAIPVAPREELAKLDEEDLRFLDYVAREYAYEKRQEMEELKRLWRTFAKNL